MDLEGSIVEFIESGGLRLGYVRKQEQRKVQIVDQRGRHSTVPMSRVLVVHERVSAEDFPTVAGRIEGRVEACQSQIDASLLWESLDARKREFTSAELAAVWFGSTSPEFESAICRKMIEEPLYFRKTPRGFEARPADQVASERLRLAREGEAGQRRREIGRVLRLALDEPSTPDTMAHEEHWPEVLDLLDRWLRRQGADEIEGALERIVGEARTREAAYQLLVRYGRIGPEEDRFLLVRGIPTAFPRETIDRAERLSSSLDSGHRMPYASHEIFAIDDEYTVEIDDALSAFEEGDETVVGIHVADVSGFVKRDDPLDREAFRRSSTIYLPNISVMMFPPRLSTDLASLVEGAPRPALTVEARFSRDGGLVGFGFLRTVISVTRRLEYQQADAAWAAGNDTLARLHRVAVHLRDERVSRGAQTHHRPDIKVHVRDGRILVQRFEADTPSRLIVSELMILANRLAATHAARSGVPIIFRTQESPLQRRPEIEGLPEVVQFEMLRKNFKRSRLSLNPSPHAGLGLDCYTQMSSPLRRYADLVTQRQFTAALEGETLPYERDELLEVMTSCEEREVEIRRLEQTSTAWWILKHLSGESIGVPLEAVVVDNKGTVELTEYLVRARLKDCEDREPGDPVTVQIESVDPERGAIRLEPCS
jgi:exoribonuclease-2